MNAHSTPMAAAELSWTPLSYAQQRLWFFSRLAPQSSAYNLGGLLWLDGALDRDALVAALDQVLARHDTLRTVFAEHDGVPMQAQLPCCAMPLEEADLSRLPAQELEQEVRQRGRAFVERPYDLGSGPQMRVALYRLGLQRHALLIGMHHIVSDAWSVRVLIEEVAECYRAHQQGREPVLGTLVQSYSDYAAGQRDWLASEQGRRQLEFWTRTLGSEQPSPNVADDFPRQPRADRDAAYRTLQLEEDLVARLRALGGSASSTLFGVLLAALQLQLARISAQREVRIGVPVAGRGKGRERLIGFFVNTLVLAGRPQARFSVREWLAQTKASLGQALAHQGTPLEQLVEALAPSRSLGQQPLFQVAFNYRHQHPLSSDWLPGCTTRLEELPASRIPFDLALDAVRDNGDRLSITFAYAADLFAERSIERLMAGFQQLLRAFVEQPDAPLATLQLLTDAERDQLGQWNQPRETHDASRLFPALFAEQAAGRPDAIALVHGAERLSYAELEARANQLAHLLIERGVQAESRVGVSLERGTGMLVAMLGILKAGGAFVPLDPDYPRERLAYMAEDSGLRWLISHSSLVERLPVPEGVEALCLDQLPLADYPASTPDVTLHPQNLAYLIYTSGSTGQPKGVAVNHAGLSMHVQTIGQRYGMTPEDVELHFASISFDGALERWTVPLAHGSRLVIRDQELWSAEKTCQVLAEEGVTISCLPPSYAQQLLDWVELNPSLIADGVLKVRSWTLGGEAFTRELYQRLQSTLKPQRIINGYGPTETVVTPLIWSAYPGDSFEAAYAPIGTAVGPRRLYVLDGELNPLPIGVAGELYIGGEVGLARGYHQRPELTAERFLPDPFGAPGERMYRTGDLVRWREDGVIDYLGRVDHQVKIRGFRIELGEIESQLLAQDGVAEAAVIARDTPSGKQLVGYVVHKHPSPSGRGAGGEGREDAQGVSLTPALSRGERELRAALAQTLPDYMVPAQIIALAKLPLTPAGKLDRAALPEPVWQTQGYEAPQSEAERILAAIWSEVLGVEPIGREAHFFELGGDSIVALQVVSRARQQGLGLTPKDVFQQQTLAQLAAVARAVAAPQAEQGMVEGPAPLLPIQARLLEREGLAPCNQYLLCELAQPFDTERLEQALQALVRHHDALRLRFHREANGWQQAHGGANDGLLQLHELTDDSQLQALCEQAQRSLDLERGPALRGLYLRQAGRNDRLLLTIHHLVVDGVSWRVLLEDLPRLYGQLASGLPVQLPAKTTAFKTWAERLQNWAEVPEVAAELPFWQAQLSEGGDLPLLAKAPGSEGERQRIDWQLPADFTRELLLAGQQAYRLRADELLLTALSRVLCAWSEQSALRLHLESHGRAPLFDDLDLSRTVGWFTSLYPLRLQPEAELAASLKTLKEQLRAVPNGGIGYGLLAQRGQVGQAQPQVLFNYLGQFDEAADGPLRLLDAGLWRDADAPMDAALVINAEQRGGALSLHVDFSPSQWQRATLDSLLERLGAELRAIHSHCRQASPRLTPSDVPLAGLDQAQLDRLAGIEDIYPLSPLQQGLLFHTQLQGAASYVNQLVLPLSGLDPQRLHGAWRQVFQRHAILRSAFLPGERALQAVRSDLQLPWKVRDWRGEADFDAALGTFCATDRAAGFDLAEAPLLRLTLLQRGEREHVLVWTLHHLLLDGWSTALLLGEVLALYHGEALPAPRGQFRDYIAWLAGQDAAAAENFWRPLLQRLDGPSRIVGCLPCRQPGSGHVRHALPLPAEQESALRAFAQRQGVTLNSLIQGAWALLLGRLTGKRRVCFGTTVAGRPAELDGGEQLLGLFINSLPVPIELPAGQALGDWLGEVQALNLSLREHEHTPLYELQRWAGSAGEALFDSLLVFENYPLGDALRQAERGELRLGRPQSHEFTHYPLTLAVLPGERLELLLAYDSAHFDAAGIARLDALLRQILAELCGDAQRPLASLDLLTDGERDQLGQWNQPRETHDGSRLFPALFAEQAAGRPAAIALVHGAERLSYAELEARSSQLAHLLIERGVRPESRVGVSLERGTGMLVAMLGILKAGGAFVPLDPDYPRERLAYMAEDSGLRWLLTHSSLAERLPLPEGVAALCLDRLALSDYPATSPDVTLHPLNLAYLIYTSGSTGQPKGVAVNHAGLSMHVQVIGQRYGMTPEDVELHFASISFDGALERWTVPLAHGSRLVIRDQELWSAEKTCQVLAEEGVTISCLPPSYAQQLLDWVELNPSLIADGALKVRSWTLGGEAFTRELYQRLQSTLKPQRIINGYGPTETVVTPLIWSAFPGDSFEAAYAPIGTAVGPRRLYVLDGELNPLPIGVAGELYIGGEIGLARGYHQRPELTAERFLPDPFGAPGERMYRTGDLVRWREDGVIDYLGRVDHQVKIRGFRIELGEIESQLLAQDGVAEAAVIASDTPSGKQLVGYVVHKYPSPSGRGAGGEGAPDDSAVPLTPALSQRERELRAALAQTLPDYMVPAQIIALAKLPLTPAGKLDRAALPEPVWQTQGYEAPQSEAERTLAAIWSEVLGVEPIGREAHFFELGGDSIVALQVVSRVRQRGFVLPLKALFDTPALVDCAGQLVAAEADLPQLRALPRGDDLPLSHAQHRLWFLNRLDPASGAYHMPAGLNLHGRLDRQALQGAFDCLESRHESLRTRFIERQGEPRQRILPPQGQRIDWHDLRTQPAEQREATAEAIAAELLATPFDLACDPLLRVAVLRLGDQEYRLLMVQHHIASDGWSMQRFIEEFCAAYAALAEGQAPTFQPLPVQYADYAQWQRTWLASGEARRQLAYWQAQLGEHQPLLELPTDHPRTAKTGLRGARLRFALPASLTGQLRALAQRENATLFSVLLAAWQTLLYRYSGQEDIRVGVPVAGRSLPQVEGVLGCFVNTLVLRGTPTGATPFRELLGELQRASRDALAHQDLPFDQLVEALQPSRSLAHHPLFQVSFNHQQVDFSGLDRLPGLRVEPFDPGAAGALFDLALDTEEHVDGSLSGYVSYACELYETRSIRRMAESFVGLLQRLCEAPGLPLAQLVRLDEQDQRQLDAWNHCEQSFDADRLLPELIAEQARQNPDAIALVHGAERVSFAELEARANRLARLLIDRGVTPDARVGLSLERGTAMIEGLLAILKAGGAFVPLDPDYPRERLAYMVEDSGLKWLVTSTPLVERLPLAGVDVICLDSVDLAGYSAETPDVRLHPLNLAYLIYTSGSTGKPKGVAINHGGLSMHVQTTGERYGMTADDVELHFSSISFDAAVERWTVPLACGSRLVIRDQALWSAEQTCDALVREGVTFTCFPPSYMQPLLDWVEAQQLTLPVRSWTLGGEAFTRETYERLQRVLRPERIINGYGPTETVITPLIWVAHPGDPLEAAYAPIGSAVGPRRLYILDGDLNPRPIGVAGELYIGGEIGLARGYHQRPDLTAERFLPDPFGAPGERMYRTGDLARWRPDGTLDYLGRIDHQVKIRGFRIELGEIEAQLMAQDSVAEAVVVARDTPTGKQLVGYLVAAQAIDDESAWKAAVKATLRAQLPEHMVPSALVRLEALPLLPNGKLERRALPEPQWQTRSYRAPRSELEQALAAIWQSVLDVPQVGLDDNFFELGGHSLLATQVVAQVRQQMNVEVPLRAFFELENLAALADSLAQQAPAAAEEEDDALREMAALLDELESL